MARLFWLQCSVPSLWDRICFPQTLIVIICLDDHSILGGFGDKVGVLGVLFIELIDPLGEDLSWNYQELPALRIIQDHIFVVVAHHEVVQVVSYELCILLLTVACRNEACDLLVGLSFEAELDCVGLKEVRLEREASWIDVGGFLVGHCSQVLHGVVGRKRVVKSDGDVRRKGGGKNDTYVGYGGRVGQVNVPDAVGLGEGSYQGLAGQQQGEGDGALIVHL